MNWTWLGIAAAAFLLISFQTGYKRGFVKEFVSLFCVALSIVIVWFINPYVNTFIRENTPVYEKVQESCRELVAEKQELGPAPGKSEQKNLIDNLGLPELLVKGITENNNAEIYRKLAVTSFAEYVSGYLAATAVNGLSFLFSFILGTALIRMITWALDLISKLPVINGVNRIAGAVFGGAKAVLFIWIALLVMTLLGNTELGRTGLELVEHDTVLSFLYENNIFMKVFMSVTYL